MEQATVLISRETEQLRRSFKPRKLKVLFIGESAPCSGKSFYRGSVTTADTKRAFEDAFGRQFKSNSDFLHFFKLQGCYLDDVSVVPVDEMSTDERERSLVASVPALSKRIGQANPKVVVVTEKKVEGHVREALAQACLDVPIYVLPPAGNGDQRAYLDFLIAILREHLPRS